MASKKPPPERPLPPGFIQGPRPEKVKRGSKSERELQPKKQETAASGPRAIVVFGPPSCGVSTALECLAEASEEDIVIVSYLGSRSVVDIDRALNTHDIVLVDVDAGLLGVEDVQTIVDAGLVSTSTGAFIRLYAEDSDLFARAARKDGLLTTSDLRAFRDSMRDVEARIHLHTCPYFMVPNLDLEECVKTLAYRAKLSK